MPIARIDGLDIYFELHGDEGGEPLILVHGYTGDVTDWRHQLPEFSRTHRVLIMDHRGHGRSEAPERSRYSIERMSRDVEELAAHVGFERYHLLGHSMGGAVAQEIALRSPGRLLSLTLHDTGHIFSFSSHEVVRKYTEQRHRLAETEGMEAVANMESPMPSPPHFPPERRVEERERMSRMSVEGFIGAWTALVSWEGTAERAQRIQASTMVIYGEIDAPPLVESAKWLAANIPGAVIEGVPEAAHSPQYERPDLFNAALRRHLDRNAGGAAK